MQTNLKLSISSCLELSRYRIRTDDDDDPSCEYLRFFLTISLPTDNPSKQHNLNTNYNIFTYFQEMFLIVTCKDILQLKYQSAILQAYTFNFKCTIFTYIWIISPNSPKIQISHISVGIQNRITYIIRNKPLKKNVNTQMIIGS